MLNLSPLLYTSDSSEKAFLSALDLEPLEREYIARAKTLVRNCLREGIPAILKAKGYTSEPPRPRFFTQGSWAYKTLNAPAHRPPQQADIDDGCYLPMSFVAETTRPSLAAKVFFEVSQAALEPLCRVKGWMLVTDKPTCIRIEISTYAHIDIPLYAIPDEEFTTLAKAAVQNYGYLDIQEAVRKAERDAWTAISRRKVLLAHREEDWIESDPRPVKEWFLSEVEAKGEQLRRVVRYLKGFRDWRWKSGGPSSILLMASAAPLFERKDRRDDLALLDVVAGMATALRGGIKNPTDTSESLTDRLGKEEVEKAAKRFEELERALRGATQASNESQACLWMQQQFGRRFPNCPERIIVTSVAASIAAAPPQPGPSELVGRQKAG